MQRMRVVSVVEDTWGCGIVYDSQENGSIQNIVTSKLEIQSKISLPEVIVNNDFKEQEIDGSQDERDNSLTYLQSSLFATILEDIITQLRILDECNNEIRVAKTKVDMKLLIALKYGIAQPDTKDELEDVDPEKLGCHEYKLNKLDSDRKYFREVIVAAYKEMTLDKSFEGLDSYVENIINTENHRIMLCEEEAKNRILRRDLNKQLRQQHNHIKSVFYETDSTIDDLKNQLEDAPLNAETRSRYVDNWQRARTEQHLQTIKDQEAPPSSVIEYYKHRTDYEQRVHSEVELLINITINETLEKVENWMEKYDKDMEGMDLKIHIKKNDYQNMLDKRLNFEETIEKHDILMKDWIHFKEEREKARLYHEKMTKSAIVVQAWWRGLLVRRQLGPFKVAKKKGGGGKKK